MTGVVRDVDHFRFDRQAIWSADADCNDVGGESARALLNSIFFVGRHNLHAGGLVASWFNRFHRGRKVRWGGGNVLDIVPVGGVGSAGRRYEDSRCRRDNRGSGNTHA